ncbi:hypothetical protein Q5752_006548 [Cryptotrichosporon argae]
MADIQNVAITGTHTEPLPKPHVVYTVQVSTPTRTWTVNRRYNDFAALHAELVASTGRAPPGALPAKHWLGRTMGDDKKIRERRAQLELYLRTILTTRDARWRTSFGWSDFLAYPTSKTAAGAGAGGAGGAASGSERASTPAAWLHDHAELVALVRAARAGLLKRDALAGMGDAAGARTASAEAKRQLRDVGARFGALEHALEAGKAQAQLGEGERRRREDMLEAVRAEYAGLLRTAEAGVRTARPDHGAGLSAGPGSGGSGWGAQPMPGAFAPGSGSGSGVSSGRVFGKPAVPAETDATRPLDDRGLLALQAHQVEQQDAQLAELSRLLRVQRGMGEEIAHEVAEQNEMLEDLDNRVTKTGGKLGRAKREMNRLG